ncbi:hypothetical protein MUG91_G265n61 [Manis pentadactyla]|nr:hypothetical protein MUG91_G265n61 [Manis pentadactyla]
MRDHRTGHMLPHQKTKPFACMEQDCSTSLSDDRSLRRHYEVKHDLCVKKEAPPEEEACGDSSPAHEVAGQPATDGLRSLVPPEASLEDDLPLPPTLLKASVEASGGPGYAGDEGDTRASKESDSDRDSCSQQHVQEPALQEALKPSWLSSDATPLFRQLFLKSQECLVSQEQVQVFQMIAKSQRIISGPQVAVASSQHAVPEGKQAALKPLQGPRPHQPPPLAPTFDSFHPGPGNPEAEGSPPHKGKTMPAYPREALPGSNRRDMKGGPKVAPAPWQPPGNPDVTSLAKQLRSIKGSLDLGDTSPRPPPHQPSWGGGDDLAPAPAAAGSSRQAGPGGGGKEKSKGPGLSQRGGSAFWTPVEKELFHKAFCVYKRNFSLIQKMVRTKTVAQCVQYYYGWKKRVTFTTSSWAPALEKRVKRKLAEADPTETKATCSPQKRRNHHPTLELKTETESGRGESVITASPSAAPKRTPEPPGRVQGQGAFPCGECERVFDKMWTRYAHMKRHRLQDPEETAVGEERPAKAFKVEEEKEEEGEMGADMGPLQG